MSALSFWAWTSLYYVALVLGYRFLAHGYMSETLDRQLLGFKNTLALSAVLAAYLLLCAIPPFLWSRRSYSHPLWRGIETFVCYAAVALVVGSIIAAADEGDWSALSGVSAGGYAWARIGSLAGLFLVFIVASWWGGRTAAARRRLRGKRRRKGRAAG